MINNRINIYSDEYQKLDDISKLKIVKGHLNELFETKSKKTIIVYHKGTKKNIPASKKGIFKNLCEREKHLEQVTKNLSINIEKNIINDKISNITEAIKKIENKINKMLEQDGNIEYTAEDPLVMVEYKGTYTLVPSSVRKEINKLKKQLEILESNKKPNKETQKPSVYVGKYLRKEDMTPRELNQIMSFPRETHYQSQTIKSNKDNDHKIETKRADKNKETKPAKTNIIKLLKDKYKTLNQKVVVDRETTREISDIVNSTIEEKESKVSNEKNSKLIILPIFTSVENKIKKIYNSTKNIINKFKKPKQKENKENVQTNTKNNKRRIAAAFCAMLLAITLIPTCKNNKKVTSNDNPNKETTSQSTGKETTTPSTSIEETTPTIPQQTEPTKPVVPETKPNNNNTQKPDDNSGIQKPNENEKEEDKISFDDKVTINKNSFIYTNSYDATYKTNSLYPYFIDNEEREIEGLVYELNGQIYIIYEKEENSIQKQKQLEEKGAHITAVLVVKETSTNTESYEGYYNIDSVKVKTKTK